MSTQTMGLETHHDDSLDIDFGFAAAPETNIVPTPSLDAVPAEQNQVDSKDDGAGANLEAGAIATAEPAPSEINYDSDVDTGQRSEANHPNELPADADYHEEVSIDANHHGEISAPAIHDNDEITWEDAEDEETETKSHGIKDSYLSNPQSDPSAALIQAALSNGSQEPGVNVGGSGDSDQDPHGPEYEVEDEAQYPEHPEDYEYELHNPGSDAQEPYEASADDVEGHLDTGHNDEYAGDRLDAEAVEVEDEDDKMADPTPMVEVDDDDLSSAEGLDMVADVPEVQVLFAGNEYSLFRDPMDDGKPYILEESLLQARASELLDALHDALSDEINDGDELVVQVQDLCLEISPMMASTLQSMSISDFAHLHAKLVSNDQPDGHHPLRLSIICKPSFSSRYQELLTGVNQGFGLSDLCRNFDTGQGVLYASPIKNELGDMEYTNDDMDYDKSGDCEQEEEEEGDVPKESCAASDDENSCNYPPDAEEEADYDGNVQEGGDEPYGHHADQDAAYEGEEEQHASGDYGNDEFMEDYSGQVETSPDQKTTRHDDQDDLDLDNSYEVPSLTADDVSFEQAADSTAQSGPGDDVIDWNDEPAKDGAQTQTAHDMNANMDTRKPILQAAPAGISGNSTPSVTIDGDNEAETNGIDLLADVGIAAEGATALDVNPSPAPPLNEISWEGDDEGDYAGSSFAECKPVSTATANSNGKRQHPEDNTEQNEDGDTVGVKRRRSS